VTERSDQADLSKPATEMLAKRALDALRGPMSRGAVPTAELAKCLDRPRSTVSRMIDRETGSSEATAFDLVVAYAFSAEKNGQQPKWESVIGSYVLSQGVPVFRGENGFSEAAMKKMLGGGFIETSTGDARTIALVGYLLHTAALLSVAEGSEPCDAASSILEMRADSYAKSTAIYSSAMRFIFSVTRRRPKGSRSVEDIVVLMHSMFDGYLIRYALDPVQYPLEALAEAVWDLSIAFTEPGFLALHKNDSPLRDELLQCAMELVRKDGFMPDLADVAAATGYDMAVVSGEFADVDVLAEMCLEKICKHAFELCALADETSAMARSTLKGFMAWLTSRVREYGPLVGAAHHARVWNEMGSILDMMLMSASRRLDPATRKEIAERLLSVARDGTGAWELALSVLLDVLPAGAAGAGGVAGVVG